MSPSPEERENFRSLLRIQVEEPDSPHLADVRKKLAEYEAMLIAITPTHITFGTAAGQTRQAYRVVEATGDTLVLQTDAERIDVRFLDNDHIAMRSDQMMLLTRDAPSGYNEKDLRGEVPGSTELGASTGGQTPADRQDDACSAYASCIDQMPQMAGDQPVMLGSASVIRGWERTPERLRQCAAALNLARNMGLCQ